MSAIYEKEMRLYFVTPQGYVRLILAAASHHAKLQ